MQKDDFWKTMADVDDLLEDKKGDTEKIKTYEDFCAYSHGNYNYEFDTRVQFLTNRDRACCIFFGTLGALTSANLSEEFAKIHDGEFTKKENQILWNIAKFLKHPKTYPDKVKGGLSHRAEYGHDMFNLNEVYECIEKDGKGDLWKGAKEYIKHVIMADPLSKQGVPIPGSSLCRDTVVKIANEDQEFYKSVLTYKHKDLVGGLLVQSLVKFYNRYYGLRKDMYRYHEMYFYSQFVNLVISYFVLTPTTMNLPVLIMMSKTWYNIYNLSKELNDGWIKEAEEILNKY